MGRLVVWAAAAAVASSPAPAWALQSRPLGSCLARLAGPAAFHGVAMVVAPSSESAFASDTEDEDTRFNLGSAGKMFTAVAVAQLIDAGKVGLDDPIGRFVAGLPASTAGVTVRQLLTHSSGLGDFFRPENLAVIDKARSASDLLPLVSGEAPAFPPGSRFSYSNSGFVLLGVLIERVSGESYGDYLARRVFGPAGMSHSGMSPDGLGKRAIGMTAMAGPGPLQPSPVAALWGGPAGGGYSTARDMQRFFAALTGARLTSPRMLSAMTSRQIVAAPGGGGLPERDYGLGFGVGLFDGHAWFGHNGGAPGVGVEFANFPKDSITVAVLSDRDPPAATTFFKAIRARVLKGGGCRP